MLMTQNICHCEQCWKTLNCGLGTIVVKVLDWLEGDYIQGYLQPGNFPRYFSQALLDQATIQEFCEENWEGTNMNCTLCSWKKDGVEM